MLKEVSYKDLKKPKGRFFWYAFGIYKPKEPSLWFVVYVVCLKSDMPQH